MNKFSTIFFITIMITVFIATSDGDVRRQQESQIWSRVNDDSDVPRVQIKVFRGSDDDLKHGNVVSWGYYVSQPSDG
ncbi:hypothetical protein PV326_002764 [Microctonus aethiopoides]|nr:hypothetical protein PV326_002764 [Microctonus aethiopoides]